MDGAPQKKWEELSPRNARVRVRTCGSGCGRPWVDKRGVAVLLHVNVTHAEEAETGAQPQREVKDGRVLRSQRPYDQGL